MNMAPALQQAFGTKLLLLLIRYGADGSTTVGGELDKTFEPFAYELCMRDVCDHLLKSHAPRKMRAVERGFFSISQRDNNDQ